VDAFRTRKETIKATYTAAEAQTRINEAFSGISEEMGDVGMAIQRAEDKTAQMQARAGAIDELMASGALDDVGGRRDDIQSELDLMSANSDVERELAMLKGELTAGAPKQLEGGAQNGAGQGTQANQAPQQSQEQGPYAPPAPPQQYAPPQQTDQKQQTQQNQQAQNQQAQPAGLPVSDLPGLQDEPQDGDRS
jgi:phage shock protein A